MRKIFIYLCLALISIVVMGCESESKSDENFTNALAETDEYINKLKNDIHSLQGKNAQIERDYQTKLIESEYFKHQLRSEIEWYRREIAKSGTEESMLLNIFNPYLIEKNDNISGFLVSEAEDISSSMLSRSVQFDGEFDVTGKVFLDEITPGYSFCVEGDELKNLPHTYIEREGGTLCLFILNSNDFEESIAGLIANIGFGYEDFITVRARLSNYTYNIAFETWYHNTVKFEKLIEIK